jgi:hypothetical protein
MIMRKPQESQLGQAVLWPKLKPRNFPNTGRECLSHAATDGVSIFVLLMLGCYKRLVNGETRSCSMWQRIEVHNSFITFIIYTINYE